MAIFYLSFLQINITLKTIIFSDKKFIQSPQKKTNNISYLRFSIFFGRFKHGMSLLSCKYESSKTKKTFKTTKV